MISSACALERATSSSDSARTRSASVLVATIRSAALAFAWATISSASAWAAEVIRSADSRASSRSVFVCSLTRSTAFLTAA